MSAKLNLRRNHLISRCARAIAELNQIKPVVIAGYVKEHDVGFYCFPERDLRGVQDVIVVHDRRTQRN